MTVSRFKRFDSTAEKGNLARRTGEYAGTVVAGAAIAGVSAFAAISALGVIKGERKIEEAHDKSGIDAENVGFELPHEMEKECSKFRSMRDDFLAALGDERMDEADKSFNKLVDYYNSEIRDSVGKHAGLRIIAYEMQEAFIEYGEKMKEIGDAKYALKIFSRGEDMLGGAERAEQGVRLEKESTLLAMANSADDLRGIIKRLKDVCNAPPDINGSEMAVSGTYTCRMLAYATLLGMVNPNSADYKNLEEEYDECKYAVLRGNNTDEMALLAGAAYMRRCRVTDALAVLNGNEERRLLAAVELHSSGEVARALELYDEFDHRHPLVVPAMRLAKIAKEQLKFRKEENLPAGRDIAGR